jgi:hypothetical protein
MSANTGLPDYLQRYSNICRVFDAALITECRSKYHSSPTWPYAYLCDPRPDLHGYRRQFDELLGFAEEHGFLDGETLGRLRTLEEPDFLSVIAELDCAKFMHDRGLPVRPRPEGRPGKRGDFEIAVSAPIFVEVKSLFDRPLEALQQRVNSKLRTSGRRATADLDVPCIIHLGHIRNPQDFRGRAFGARVREELTAHRDNLNLSFTYIEPSGFSVDVKVQPWPTGRTAGFVGPWIWTWGRTEPYIRAIDSAMPQLPNDGRPCIVVLRPWLTFPPDAEDLAIVWDKSFARGARPRVSAIAILTADNRAGGYALTMNIYANPTPRYPLPLEHMRRQGILVNVRETGRSP